MPRPPEEDLYYEFFKAKHTTQYLENYTTSHSYNGQTLRDRIKFGIEVKSIKKLDGAWALSTENVDTGTPCTFQATKLVVASGLTSEPFIPALPDKEKFNGPIIHQEKFGSSSVLKSPDVKNICVLGGGKSSADMIYEAVLAGKKVTWILKASDTTGPGFLVSPKGKGPYKNAFEMGSTRAAATFTPSPMVEETWWTRFLHSSKIGTSLTRSFWAAIDKDLRKEADYEHRENVGGFQELSPHTPIFWQNGTGGLLNHSDFFSLIAQNVKTYCADISTLDRNLVRVQSGEEIPCDAILCGTGWVPSLQFFSREQKVELGLPHAWSDETPAEQEAWAELEATADETVLSRFPLLADPPPHFHKPVTHTPYRLYNLIAPLFDVETDRSIVFIGHIIVGNYFLGVEAQSMWATAYLDRKLDLPDAKERRKEVALTTAWCRRRYLTNGEKGIFITFDLVGYTDQLLKQLGLKTHRKKWFKNWFEPCRQSNFRQLKNEYVGKYEKPSVVPVATGAGKA
ncbi:MAG: hypothetical protein Q9201_003263 [Fulgogasparrea decipioides]